MKYTPDEIKTLKANQIIVFGSNTEGRHGAGLAKICHKKWGAVYGRARGLQGKCYAIVTKDLALGKCSVPLEEISRQIDELLLFARQHPGTEVLVTKIGCGLGGYTEREIASCFRGKAIPGNVVLPECFADKAMELR